MPAYNEEEIIETCVREWYDEVIAKLPGSELIVVNDCSKDATGDVLARLAAELPGLKAVQPDRNGGHGKALRFGFRYATQEYVFQTDSDRQHKPAEFWLLWEQREHNDFVFGIRVERADGTFRLFITRSMRYLNFLIWGIWIRDANCPFKLMRRGALMKVLQQIPEDCFIPMVMVSILARKYRFRVAEVLVTHLPRRGGQQSLKGLLRWFRVAGTCSAQLFRLRLSSRLGPYRHRN
jgi:glycosyltransferase involved in cell wall biosynthesis